MRSGCEAMATPCEQGLDELSAYATQLPHVPECARGVADDAHTALARCRLCALVALGALRWVLSQVPSGHHLEGAARGAFDATRWAWHARACVELSRLVVVRPCLACGEMRGGVVRAVGGWQSGGGVAPPLWGCASRPVRAALCRVSSHFLRERARSAQSTHAHTPRGTNTKNEQEETWAAVPAPARLAVGRIPGGGRDLGLGGGEVQSRDCTHAPLILVPARVL